MANCIDNSIIISSKSVKKAGGFVILPLKEYERLRQEAIPTYYLHNKEARDLDKLVNRGEREYREGKCKEIKSLSDLD